MKRLLKTIPLIFPLGDLALVKRFFLKESKSMNSFLTIMLLLLILSIFGCTANHRLQQMEIKRHFRIYKSNKDKSDLSYDYKAFLITHDNEIEKKERKSLVKLKLKDNCNEIVILNEIPKFVSGPTWYDNEALYSWEMEIECIKGGEK